MAHHKQHPRRTRTPGLSIRGLRGNRLRHLPVMHGGKLVGLVSIGDLVKDIISEQQFIIEQLEFYISGKRG